MPKKISLFLIIISLIVSGFLLFNFRKTGQVGAEISSPKITNASVEPKDVQSGQTMVVRAEIEDETGIKEVKADMGGIETIDLELKEGTEKKGKWQAEWLVHDVETRAYITKIEAINILNQKDYFEIEWSDPTWVQTSQADFNAGVLSQVDTASSPNNVLLAQRNCWGRGGSCNGSCLYSTMASGTYYTGDSSSCLNSANCPSNTYYTFSGACNGAGSGNCYIIGSGSTVYTTCNTHHDDPSCAGSCTGGTSTCSTYGSSGSCGTCGCSWNAASCSGSCSCSGKGSSACPTCGCTWTPSCGGTWAACSSHGNQGSCEACDGCTWTGARCTGSGTCSGTGTCASCGCTVGGSCSGSCSCSSYGSGSCGTCGCSWNAASCSAPSNLACSAFGVGTCTSCDSCSWVYNTWHWNATGSTTKYDAGTPCYWYVYYASGTIASQVYDSGLAGTTWNQLSWTETLAANTDITFQVRASDTLFAKDAASPSWTSLGAANSPITSGLPSGRYQQWRATLITTNYANTPILQDVTISFTTSNTTPDIPTLNSPADGATGISLTPALKFNYSDPDANNCTKFDLQVDDDPAFGLPEVSVANYSTGGPWTSGSAITYPVTSGLSGLTKYYWKVRVFDGTAWSTWSDGSWDFTTTSAAGACPLKLTTPGVYYVRYRSVDNAGNWEATKSQKVTIVSNNPPLAAISCDASSGCSPGGSCASWIAYRPTADPNPCIFTLLNNSTDQDSTNCPTPCNNDIVKSDWYIKKAGEPDTAYALLSSYIGISNYTFQSGTTAGDYVIKLYVEDSKGAPGSATQLLTIKDDISADFMCSKNNLDWQTCESLSGLTEGEVVYLKDDSSLSKHSTRSDGASAFTSRIWAQNGVVFAPSAEFGGNETNPYVALAGSTIRLTVADNAGRSDYEEHIIGVTLPLPKWKEILPF